MQERIESERAIRQELLGTATNYSRAAASMVGAQGEDSSPSGAKANSKWQDQEEASLRNELLGKQDAQLRQQRNEREELVGGTDEWAPEAQEAMEAQRKKQEELTDNLLEMTKDLKERQTRIGNTLTTDNKVRFLTQLSVLLTCVGLLSTSAHVSSVTGARRCRRQAERQPQHFRRHQHSPQEGSREL